LFEEALALPNAVGLNIATRADCLPDEVIEYLASLSERTTLTVELGLQTVHDATAALINRGHTFADFERAYRRLRELAPKARIGVHLIFGLPGENDAMMLDTVRRVAAMRPDEVKIHLLYVVRGTRLAAMYETGEYEPLTMERYVDLVTHSLTLLPPETVIGRLTGDGEEGALIAPLWSRKKLCVLNEIDKALYAQNLWQGKNFFL
jgi:radical SAM protein (TIGR01212 family)